MFEAPIESVELLDWRRQGSGSQASLAAVPLQGVGGPEPVAVPDRPSKAALDGFLEGCVVNVSQTIPSRAVVHRDLGLETQFAVITVKEHEEDLDQEQKLLAFG
jgi:hypothetical protein